VAKIFHELIANRISGFFAMDVIISGSRAALVYSKRRQTLADVPALVAVDWDTDRWCIAWLAAFSLFTTGQVRPSKRWSLKTLEPMTTNDFRELALNFPEAIESAHMSHPDFGVGAKNNRRSGPCSSNHGANCQYGRTIPITHKPR
jgi:hypothetical protein